MTCWWQDLDTGEVFERPDHATCRREALEHLLHSHHKVYISHTRIPVSNGAAYRNGGLAPPVTVEAAWDAEPEEEVWSV